MQPVLKGQLGPDTGSQSLTPFYRTILMVQWITPERLNGSGNPRRGSEVDDPCPNEIVPGVASIRAPIAGMMGV